MCHSTLHFRYPSQKHTPQIVVEEELRHSKSDRNVRKVPNTQGMDGGGKRPRVINTASKSTGGKGVQRRSGSSHARSAAAGRAEVFDSEADRATTKGTGECEHTTRRRQQFSHNSHGCASNICFFAQSRPDTYAEVLEEDQYEKDRICRQAVIAIYGADRHHRHGGRKQTEQCAK